MEKIEREITLTTGFKLRLEESCPQRVLDKIDEVVEWIKEHDKSAKEHE